MSEIDLFPGYVIDTSALIDLRWYPEDLFKKNVWKCLEKLIAEKKLIAPSEVFAELQKQKDDIYRWTSKHKFFVQLTPALFSSAQGITKQFPGLVDPDKLTPDADPFVVALAQSRGWKVVTQERAAKPGRKPKIPDVCQHCGIVCLNLFEFFRENKSEF